MTLTFADRLNARVPLSLTPHTRCLIFCQVADSVIGRWFRLEGSGHPREREGSRFMVCRLTSRVPCARTNGAL